MSDLNFIKITEPKYNWLMKEGYICSVVIAPDETYRQSSSFNLTQSMVDYLLKELKKYGSD